LLIARGNALGKISQDRMRHTIVAVEEGFTAERPVGRQFSSADIRRFPDRASALSAVASGAADVYMGVAPDVNQLLATPKFSALAIVPLQDDELSEASFAVPAGRNTLRNDLNERLMKLDPQHLVQIRARWQDAAAASVAGPRKFVLTEDERAYLLVAGHFARLRHRLSALHLSRRRAPAERNRYRVRRVSVEGVGCQLRAPHVSELE
jgi:hypothetical protein